MKINNYGNIFRGKSILMFNFGQWQLQSKRPKIHAAQGSQIRRIWRILRQNCSDDSTEVTEGVASTLEISGNKQGATSTPEIFGNKHSFVLSFFATHTVYVNCKRCKPFLNHRN